LIIIGQPKAGWGKGTINNKQNNNNRREVQRRYLLDVRYSR